MTTSKVEKRLQRLTESDFCSCEAALEYSVELKELADKKLSVKDSEAKSRIFKALASATRLRILGLLSSSEMCVCEIMVALELTQPTASHHLRILENVGLVKDRKKGKWVFYSIANPEFIEGVRKLDLL